MKILKSIIMIVAIFLFVLITTGTALSVKFYKNSAAIFKSSADNTIPLTVISELKKTAGWEKEIKIIKGEEENRTNILLLGKGGKGHPGGELTDAIMLLSIKFSKNAEDKKIADAALISIPRDLYVPIPDTPYFTRINAIKAYGSAYLAPKKTIKSAETKEYLYLKEKAGMDLLKKTVNETLGVPVHYYLELDFEGFINIIDMLGGIDFTLQEDLYDPLYPGPNYSYDPFYMKKGAYRIDGKTTLKLMRSRHSPQGDFNRITRQQELIGLIKNKVISGNALRDLFLFSKIFENLEQHFFTDMRISDFKLFWELGKTIDPQKITYKTIDKDPSDGLIKGEIINGANMLVPKSGNYDDIRDAICFIFDEEKIKELNEKIKNRNSNSAEKKEELGIAEEKPTVTVMAKNQNNSVYEKVLSNLKNKGFKIIKLDEPQSGDLQIEQTIIYDNAAGQKPASLKYLEKSFNAKIIEPEENDDTEADFTIFLNI